MTDRDQLTDKQAARRRDGADERMPATPAQPRTAKPKTPSLSRRSTVQDAHDKHANTDRDPHN